MKLLKNFKPFAFQTASITELIEKVTNNGGGCIFDETGLGKTITAATTAINLTDGLIAVMAPNATIPAWEDTLKGVSNEYEVTTHKTLPKGSPKVLIIDEAHNFKNETSTSYKELFLFIKKHTPIVILASATPFQNKIMEYRNMLALIHFKTNTPAFIMLGYYLNKAAEKEKNLDTLSRYYDDLATYNVISARSDNSYKRNALLEKAVQIVGTFSIRNTRQYVKTNFAEDVEMMGHFPKVNEYVIKNDIFTKEEHYIIHDIVNITKKMKFALQNVVSYLIKKNEMPASLGAIIRTFLLKRLDSSVYAFKCSIDKMINRINELLDVKASEIIIGKSKKAEKVEPHFYDDLELDLISLNKIKELAEPLNDDAKLNVLFQLIADKQTVVFTEYNDTLELLVNEATKRGLKKFVSYNGQSKEKELLKIIANFDANTATKEDIKVLFATDVLAEGANLHKADNLIHFDQKWNPSKIVQRNGRVNRICKTGVQREVSIYNYQVDGLIENIIELEKKVTNKTDLAERVVDFSDKLVLNHFPKTFVAGKTLLFENGGEKQMFRAYKTYMGVICVNYSIQMLMNDRVLDFHSKYEPHIDNYVDYADRLYFDFSHNRVYHIFYHTEFDSGLYNRMWNILIKEKVDQLVTEQGGNKLKEFESQVMEMVPDREPLEICEYWINGKYIVGDLFKK